jgi:hypothetical protein
VYFTLWPWLGWSPVPMELEYRGRMDCGGLIYAPLRARRIVDAA